MANTAKTEPIELSLEALYRSYGYTKFKMSKFEEYELYAENKNFLVSGQIITFTDTTGRLMALKPDVTLAIVKNTKDEPDTRKKLFYTESVYRVSQKSSTFREIQQSGVECLGNVDALCLAEIITMAKKALLLISEESALAISNLDLVGLAVKALGIRESREGAILDCVGEKNLHGIDEIMKEEGLPLENASLLKLLLKSYGKPSSVFASLEGKVSDPEVITCLDNFKKTLEAVDEDKIVIDFSTLGDMRYYTGIVFRGYVNGIAENLLSGGEYNRLMRKMKKTSSAVGFALYLDLVDGMENKSGAYDYDAVILYDDETATDALKSAEALRAKGLRVIIEREIPKSRSYKTVYTVKGGKLCERDA